MSKLLTNWKVIFFEETKIIKECVVLENGSNVVVLCFRCHMHSHCCTFLGAVENNNLQGDNIWCVDWRELREIPIAPLWWALGNTLGTTAGYCLVYWQSRNRLSDRSLRDQALQRVSINSINSSSANAQINMNIAKLPCNGYASFFPPYSQWFASSDLFCF